MEDIVQRLADDWFVDFNTYAGDLYPGRYTAEYCLELAEQAVEIKRLAAEVPDTLIVAHNYLRPEFHRLADLVGDSLGLAHRVQRAGASRVYFQSVYFMGETAKITVGDATRVYVSDTPQVLSCSLVEGTDYDWVLKWKRDHPDGIIITYVNCSAYAKSLSHYVSTSRNTEHIIVEASRRFPGRPILVMPDRFLGYVMKVKASRHEGVNPDLIHIYAEHHNGNHACCYVHEKIVDDVIERALDDDPDAELILHPECGCVSECLSRIERGVIPRERAHFLSTEAMIDRVRTSPSRRFLIATELGMVYRLRREVPDKECIPVSFQAECKYMKENTFPKLLDSLRRNRREIVFCENCCDPRRPYQDDRVIHVRRDVATGAKVAIDRMLEIQ